MQVLQQAKALRFLDGFWALRQRMFRRVSPVLQNKHGIDLSDLFLLIHIEHSDLSPSEIAEEMQIPAHGISRKLDAFNKQGFIKRTLHPQDARKRVLSLTKKGQTTLQKAQITLEEEVNRLLEPLSEEKLELFLSDLETLSQ